MGSLLLDNPGIDIFGFRIYYYALCILTGIITATSLSALLMKRRNISPDLIFTLFIFCIPSALICARLFYCITDGMNIRYWFAWENIREGGLSIIGGVIGGVGMGVAVCLVKKVSFFRVADCVVITILIAQAIGRWGNFFNQEVFGSPITDPKLQWFPFAVYVDSRGGWYHAFFFYESVINLLGFALLYTAAWFFTKKPNGIFTFAYFVYYGTVRAIMEPLRDPTYILSGGGVPWSQVFSYLMIILGAAGIMTLLFLNYYREGKWFGSKKGEPCGIKEYIPAAKDDVPYFSKINLFGSEYPKKPEELTFKYKWNKFREKIKGGGKKDGPSDEGTETKDAPQEREQEDNPKGGENQG